MDSEECGPRCRFVKRVMTDRNSSRCCVNPEWLCFGCRVYVMRCVHGKRQGRAHYHYFCHIDGYRRVSFSHSPPIIDHVGYTYNNLDATEYERALAKRNDLDYAREHF